jgi:hypothetical protein
MHEIDLEPVRRLQCFVALAQRTLDIDGVGDVLEGHQRGAVRQRHGGTIDYVAVGAIEPAHDRLAIFDCRDGRPQALPNRVVAVERERQLAQRLDMGSLGKCFRREPPHAGEDRIEKAQPAVTAEHGDRLGKIVQGLALDPDQRIVAAFEIEPFGDVIE